MLRAKVRGRRNLAAKAIRGGKLAGRRFPRSFAVGAMPLAITCVVSPQVHGEIPQLGAQFAAAHQKGEVISFLALRPSHSNVVYNARSFRDLSSGGSYSGRQVAACWPEAKGIVFHD